MSKIICGKNSVFDAIKNKVKINKIYSLKPLTIDNIEVQVVDKNFLNNLTNLNHQGIVAIINDEFNYSNFDKLKKEKPEIVLILDHIEDDHNLGAIIRTANAANVKFIIIPDKRAASINNTVLKISSGGFVGMNIIKVPSLQHIIEKLKEIGYWIYSSAINEQATPFNLCNPNYPLAIIVGNEAKGISNTLLKASDGLIYIPMNGSVQSLNVSVATGILLFDLVNKLKK